MEQVKIINPLRIVEFNIEEAIKILKHETEKMISEDAHAYIVVTELMSALRHLEILKQSVKYNRERK